MTEVNITIEDIVSTDATKIIKRVAITGQLDESNIDEKSQLIYQLITQFPKGLYLIFDFEKLDYMNSKSIGYLTDWYGKITAAAGQIMIIKAKPNIIDILQVIGLTQLIPMYGSLDEAKFAIQNAAATPAVAPSTSEPVISTNLKPSEVVAPVAPPAPAPTPAVITPVATVEPAIPAPVSIPTPIVTTPVIPETPVIPAPAEPVVTPVIPVTPPAPTQS